MSTTSLPTEQTAPEFERPGTIERFQFKLDGHTLHYDADEEFAQLLTRPGSLVGGAEGGYLLIRFDVDEEDFSVVHVEPPGGWWPTHGAGPTEMVERAASYLAALRGNLERLEALLEQEPESPERNAFLLGVDAKRAGLPIKES